MIQNKRQKLIETLELIDSALAALSELSDDINQELLVIERVDAAEIVWTLECSECGYQETIVKPIENFIIFKDLSIFKTMNLHCECSIHHGDLKRFNIIDMYYNQ